MGEKSLRLRLFSMIFMLVCGMLVLSACGSDNQTDSGKADTNEGGEEITKLVAGTDATYAPMEYIDDNGDIVGINIDIVDAIAEELGIEVEYVNIGWDPLFPAVKNGEVDFAVSSITITEERKKEMDFTEPYYVANQLILTSEDSDITNFADLEDKRVAVQMGTTGHHVVQELLGETSPNILAADSMPLAISEMI